MVSLEKLIKPSKTVDAEMPGFDGFVVSLSYLTRDELVKIRDKATTKKISRKTRQVEDDTDNELFQQLYIKAVIKGWSGLKYKYLEKLLPVDLSDIEDDEDELVYSTENAELLMKNSTTFDSWVTDVLDDVTNFTKRS